MHYVADQASHRRVALVIGNNAYKFFRPLESAVNDAEDVATTLKGLNFEVDLLRDATFRSLETTINRFVDRIQPSDVVLVYYAGHGVQIENENYLVPVDLDAKDEADAKYGAYSASKLHDKLQATGARLKIFIMDACRNNPFRTSRSLGQGGLAQMNSGIGSYIAFATAPGRVANEKRGERNGIFTKHLMLALRKPGLKLSEVFDQVRAEVYEETNGQQFPWSSTSVIGDFYFREPLPKAEPTPEIKEVIRIREVPKEVVKEVIREVPKEVIREVHVGTAGQTRRSAKDKQDYVWIPAGRFEMGCVDKDNECAAEEKPRRSEEITQGFWLGVTEVEVKSYRLYLEEKGQKLPASTFANDKWKFTDHPMTRVNWDEAQAYCAWAGGRLPTENEWEYAARGGIASQIYPSGNEMDHNRANYAGKKDADKYEFTAPVKTFEPNGFGLYDMAGNVWEWVAETNEEAAKSAGHMIRGGGWYDGPRQLRISMTARKREASNEVGFRCVKTDWK